ncbi:hypothetical protein C8F04DRAFT_403782 [Mycena alexandri]|uniref:Transmembrane protein n=1 Tax=Mycena alexandri TaxID=1745969 RepID=A0AAD6X5S1_9AGAR|nr:hypothetical protein C8F04DRAFT_403782 [Mycena alexandri]
MYLPSRISFYLPTAFLPVLFYLFLSSSFSRSSTPHFFSPCSCGIESRRALARLRGRCGVEVRADEGVARRHTHALPCSTSFFFPRAWVVMRVFSLFFLSSFNKGHESRGFVCGAPRARPIRVLLIFFPRTVLITVLFSSRRLNHAGTLRSQSMLGTPVTVHFRFSSSLFLTIMSLCSS